MSVLEKIAKFIVELSYESLPEKVTPAVKRAFIDTLGVCIAGINEEASVIVRKYVKENQGKPVCSVVGGGFKTHAADAALANGTSLHALDFDDTGAYTQGHPSAPVFPVILAIAEEKQNNGKEIIEAYTVGVEILSRLARAMPMMHLKGWHPTSVLGNIASAATAAKLLKLDTEKTANALSIAGSMAGGLIKNFGTMTKPFHVGNACRNGIEAAKLALQGFSASLELFEGDLSFPSSFFWRENTKLDDLINSIGNPLAIIDPGINIKKYPSCSLSHRAIEAAIKICSSHNISPENILSVECRVPPRAKQVLFYDSPKNGLEGKFSMQYVLALAIKYRTVIPSHFTTKNINDPTVKRIMRKIDFKVHEDWKVGDDARADIVIIKLRDDKELIENVAIPNGNVKDPLSEQALSEKFNNCTLNYLNKQNISNALDFLNKLESVNTINKLMSQIQLVWQ